MARPTLLQSVFNRPSQSYLPDANVQQAEQVSDIPPQKNYYSAKAELIRIAQEQHYSTRRTSSLPTHPPSHLARQQLSSIGEVETPVSQLSESETETDNDDVFYTPNTSPRASMSVDDFILPSPRHIHIVTQSDTNEDDYPVSPLRFNSSNDSISDVATLTSMDDQSTVSFAFSAKHGDITPPTSYAPSDIGSREEQLKSVFQWPVLSSTSGSPPNHTDNRTLSASTLKPSFNSRSSLSLLSSRTSIRTSSFIDTQVQIEVISSSKSTNSLPSRTSRGRRAKPSRSIQSEHLTSRSKLRMSAVLEVDEVEEKTLIRTPSAASSRGKRRHSRTRSRSTPASQRGGQSVASTSTSAITVDVPASPPMLGGSTGASFGQLLLPQAEYRPSSNPIKEDGLIDLVGLGLTHVRMSSIEIQKNAALKLSSSSFGSVRKRRISQSFTLPKLNDPSLPPVLSIASQLRPPTSVGPNQVLVQVWAVAVDGLDGIIVEQKCRRVDSAGFVPGRSFVGRVIEVGYTVKEAWRGAWVHGLLEATKCGALTEFIVVDKRRVSRAPQPTHDLTVEQVAVLPLFGIPAQRAMTSLQSKMRIKGANVLVLQSHQGLPALITQSLCALGAKVTRQNPTDEAAETRASTLGLSTVLKNDYEVILAKLETSTFDAIIDPIGGPSVWQSCQRILRPGGQFVTLIGDSVDPNPDIKTQMRLNLRSLKQTFSRKDKKRLGYTWVSPTAPLDANSGEDLHDTLVTVTSMTENGIFVPFVEYVVSFENVVHHLPRPTVAGDVQREVVVTRIMG